MLYHKISPDSFNFKCFCKNYFSIESIQCIFFDIFPHYHEGCKLFYLGIGMKFYYRTKYVTLETGSKNSLLDSDLIIGNKFTHIKFLN